MEPESIIITLAVLSGIFVFFAYKGEEPKGTFWGFLKMIKSFFL